MDEEIWKAGAKDALFNMLHMGSDRFRTRQEQNAILVKLRDSKEHFYYNGKIVPWTLIQDWIGKERLETINPPSWMSSTIMEELGYV